MKKKWIVAIFLGGMLSGAFVIYILQILPSKSERTDKPDVEELEIAASSESVAALGRLEPRDKVLNLAPPSAVTQARVEELRVKEGDWVSSNQIIAVLDTYSERLAQLEEANKQVESAQAKLEQVLAGAKQGEVEAQRATISQLEAQLEGDLRVQKAKIDRLQAEYDNAVSEYERFQALFEEGATSESSRDVRRTAMISAQKQIQEAEEVKVQLLKTGGDRLREAKATLARIQEVRPADVTAAQADVETAQAAQSRAEVVLQNAIVRSPIAGEVLRIHAQPGELVTSEGILTLGQTDAMYAIAEVYEADIEQVAVGQRATVTSEYGGFSGELSGVVEQVGGEVLSNSLYDPNPTSQSEARIIEVAVRLDKADGDRVSQLTNLQVRVLIEID